MKIVFLNVWGDEMQDKLVPYLKEQVVDTDIFCFQEATEDMKRRCSDVLSQYVEISDSKFHSDDEVFLQATFVKKGVKVLSSGTLMADNMGCGLALYTEIKADTGSIFVCNVHGKSRPGDKLDNHGRLIQSKELIDFFKNKDEPVIIGGDFNILPKTQSIEMFEQHGYRDLIKEFTIDTTRNHFAWERFPVKMLYSDYVFLNDSVQLKNFEVPKNEVSDHLPLLLELAV